jgi:predicted dehydrogenase
MTQRVGLIGCGHISHIYLMNAPMFKDITFTSCASLRFESAVSLAECFKLDARSVTDLLASDDVDIVLNLTVPTAHTDISLAALAAGKHVYTEKPLGISVEECRRVMRTAQLSGLRVGCAPDTVLGPGVQMARQLIADGAIGRPIFGTSMVISRGMEMWHPNPEFFFKVGGGPALDLGPYYLTALVHLLGPVAAVVAEGKIGNARRTISSPTSLYHGDVIEVETLTTVQAILEFECGAHVSVMTSWDASIDSPPTLQIHGTDGSLLLPDPNWFGGDVSLTRRDQGSEIISTAAMTFGNVNWPKNSVRVANYRGVGLADMARSIESGVTHRASAELGFHIVSIVEAMFESARTGRKIALECAFSMPDVLTESEARDLCT